MNIQWGDICVTYCNIGFKIVRFSLQYLPTFKPLGMLPLKCLVFTAWISILKWFSFCSWRSLSSTSLSLTSMLSLISTTQWFHISQYQFLGLQHVQQACQTGSSQAAFGLCDFLLWLGNLEENGAGYLL